MSSAPGSKKATTRPTRTTDTLRWRSWTRAAPLAVLALAFVVAPTRALGRSFDYLHVEADSGASSGGHAAIRFGDDTYHFVNAAPSIVRAVRERSDEFDYVYRAYDNRSIDVTRVEVSDHTYEALRTAFVRRVLVEDAQLDALDSARSDEALVEALATWSPLNPSSEWMDSGIALRGAGYFYGGRSQTASTTDGAASSWTAALERIGVATIARLRGDVERELGRGWIERQAAQLDREIRSLRYTCAPPGNWEPNRVPATGADFAGRYKDLLLARLALDVLAMARAPVPEGFRTSPHRSFMLEPQEIQAVRARAARTRLAINKLLLSSRSDRGFPLLIAMARLVAMDTSVALGRLVVLDIFENEQDTITPEELGSNEIAAVVVLEEKRNDVEEDKRSALRAAASDEIAWTQLELSANFYLELERGISTGALIRVDPAPVPSRSAAVDPAWPHPTADAATLTHWRSCARDVAEAMRTEIERLYGYDLVSRNCVTEIFATIDSAFEHPTSADSPAAEERAALGGYVDGERGLNFIPYVSAAAVNDTYRVTERLQLPSYRHYWLERMLGEHDSIGVRLRESNTLTSRLYQRGTSDVFLFFTDDEPALRPILGLTNVLVGTGATAAGVLALPFDRGELALGGLRGVLFSLPELAFVNIRKGSNAIVPRDWMRTPAFDAGYANAQDVGTASTQ